MTLVVGDRVRVLTGPFERFSGEIVEVIPDQKKVVVQLTFMQRVVRAEFDFATVMKEPAP